MMNSKNNRLQGLIQSYMDDRIGVDELNELKTYLRNTANDEELDSAVNELWSEIDLMKPLSIESDLMYKRILEDERVQEDREKADFKKKSKKIMPLILKHWFPRVAAILFFSTAFFFYYKMIEKGSDEEVLMVQRNIDSDVLPGGNKAVLTLADGTTINLDMSANGDIAEDAGMRIIKTKEGEVFYEAMAGEILTAGHHVINTPRGGEYKLILPDGTKVWLNSSSSLRYPIPFDKEERIVELTGEAYFEVASKKSEDIHELGKRQPFVVKSNFQTVEVLGTHFNINSYDNESSVKTTLFEGSVRVKKGGIESKSTSPSQVVLKPGQQAQLNAKNKNSFQVLTVDLEEAKAWRNGNFLFKNTPLNEVMNQLSRWYDVEVDKENMPGYRFNGFIPRDEPLGKVLEMLELTGDLKFEMNNKKISILK